MWNVGSTVDVEEQVRYSYRGSAHSSRTEPRGLNGRLPGSDHAA